MKFKLLSFLLGSFLALLVVVVIRHEPELGAKKTRAADADILVELDNKTPKQKANIKGEGLASLKSIPKTDRENYSIEIASVEAINGGVQVFARAWENGEQIGFGADGTVDLERFRIFNPPVLVADANGTITRTSTKHGETTVRKLKVDFKEALLQVLEQTIAIKTEKQFGKVIAGKVGNTTSVFYPAAGAAEPVDGTVARLAVTETWATIQSATGNTPDSTTAADILQVLSSATTDRWVRLYRAIFGFDTSALGTDTISSATFSLWARTASSNDGAPLSQTIYVDRKVPASTSALANGDYDASGWDTVDQSDTHLDADTFGATLEYKDWLLNATGRGNVNKTGLSWYGIRFSGDFTNTSPTWNSDAATTVRYYTADNDGTTNDPKLTVEHAAAAGGAEPGIIIIDE